MSSSRPLRLQDIADKAGFSKATVSLALRNHASIPPKTRELIQALAEEMGYRPNPLVSALMTYRRNAQPSQPTDLTLAVVMNFSRGTADWKHYLSEDLLTSAAARASQLGYRVEEFWRSDLKVSGEKLSSILYSRGIPGVIIAPLPSARGHLRMEWSNFAAVAIGHSLVRPELHRVTTNRFTAMREALRQLRRSGYKRVGLAMMEDQDSRVDHQWGAAFVWEQQEQSTPAQRTELFLATEHEWTERRFAQWFKANKPDVVLGYDVRIVTWLKNLGHAVPGDVGFVHLWNPDRSGEYAGIYHDPPAIGAAAVDFVVGMIQRNERGLPESPQTLMLDAHFQGGATLKAD